MYCRYCGKEINDNEQFCPYCGSRISGTGPSGGSVPPSPPKKLNPYIIIIILLAALLAGAVIWIISRDGNTGDRPAGDGISAEIEDQTQDTGTPAEETGDQGEEDGAETLASLGAVEHNGHHYLIVDEAGYWSEARSSCESLGGHMVTITSQDEQDFIESYIIKSGYMKHYWLGATDEYEEGDWEWITGESWSYNNWCPGQPNNTEYVDSEHGQDYLELQVTKGDKGEEEYMTWTDICDSGVAYNTVTGEDFQGPPDYNSTEYYGYICEWDE